jgi:hypothetical protein
MVDFDDESAAQMLYLEKKMKKYSVYTQLEDISEMFLTYK